MEVKQIKSKFLRNIFDQNTYVVTNENEAVIIDAGAEPDDVKAALCGKKVLAVLITHLHFDHIWNLEKYISEFDCDVFIQSGAEDKFSDPGKNASHLISRRMTINIAKNRIKYYAEKSKIGKFDVEVFKTPGHSSDSVCIKIGDYLFTGDTVFSDAIGRTDFYDGNSEEMLESLRKIAGIKFKIACPGHYEECTEKDISDTIKTYL